MADMHEYRNTADISPFGRWFAGLDQKISRPRVSAGATTRSESEVTHAIDQ